MIFWTVATEACQRSITSVCNRVIKAGYCVFARFNRTSAANVGGTVPLGSDRSSFPTEYYQHTFEENWVVGYELYVSWWSARSNSKLTTKLLVRHDVLFAAWELAACM